MGDFGANYGSNFAIKGFTANPTKTVTATLCVTTNTKNDLCVTKSIKKDLCA